MVRLRNLTLLLLAVVFACGAPRKSEAGLMININDLSGGGQAFTAFSQAAQIWQGHLMDNITVNIDFDFKVLGAGILGGASASSVGPSLSLTRTALNADQKSAADATAVANLPGGTTFQFRTNDVSGAVITDNDGSDNNKFLRVHRANAKALGLIDPHDAASDGSIELNSSVMFDFDPSDGITVGKFDFVGISLHEIGHILGFVSGVDLVDTFHGPGAPGLPGFPAPLNLNDDAVFSVLDLYRYSDESLAISAGTQDFAYGPHAELPFFSIDGGTTELAPFETGLNQGKPTRRQASHWRDNLGLGIHDPTFAPGELGVITPLDLMALDVIGYDLAPVPEPNTATIALVLCAFGFAYSRIQRRRQSAAAA